MRKFPKLETVKQCFESAFDAKIDIETIELKKHCPDRIFVNWNNSIRYWYFPNTRIFERVNHDYNFD